MATTQNAADAPILGDLEPTIGATTTERAGYIEDMVREMERLAVGRELERLRDLLRLAREEARRRAFG